jgi:PAS domain S-box-containing protein
MKMNRTSKSTKNVDTLSRQYESPMSDDTLGTFEKASEALKKKHELFYDELPDLLRTIDKNGIIINCNKAYCETFGYSKNELIGKSVFDSIAEEGNETYKNSFKQWTETGNVKNEQVWFKKKDGTKFLGLVSANNLYDENGNMIGSNTIIKDITEIYDLRAKIDENEKLLQDQLSQFQKSNSRLTIAEQKYRNLYDKTPVLLRTITVDGILTDCNEAYTKFLGYTREEAMGMSIYDHTAERSYIDMKNNFENWLKTKETQSAEIWMKRKDGSIFPALLSGTSLYDETGNMIGRTLALTDMTEIYQTRNKIEENQKQLQDQIRQLEKINSRQQMAEQKYRHLYEKSPGLLRTISEEGFLMDCNEAYAQSLGYTKEEALGMSFYDHTAERSINDLKEDFEKWKETNEISHREIWLKRKNGSIFPTMMSGTSLYDVNNKLIGRTVVLTDLTEIYETKNKLHDDEQHMKEQYEELKQAHELLTITEKRYKTLYEKTPVLLRTITVEGILTDCNEAYARSLGYTKEETIGMSFYDHTAERSIKELTSSLESWKTTHDVSQKEIWMKRKDGSIFPTLLSGASIYDEHGNVIGRTVALTDMSEIYDARKKLEEKEIRIRAQYDELKKLDVAKEEFTSMISHELKTPLTPIMGWCQALQNPKILGDLTPKQLQAVSAIQSNAVKLRDLVGDMLDSQKLDMKRMKFDHKYVDVTEMMNFMTKNLASVMEPKHIQFVNSTEEGLVLKSDKSRLEQVLNNIILNAMDFVPENGRIDIKAENQEGKILFTIKDNGIGIPKDKQHNLFKQFYQLDTTATRKHGGSGLGLSICRGIVEALGGKIWVESDTGMGSIFHFTIPTEYIEAIKIEEPGHL